MGDQLGALVPGPATVIPAGRGRLSDLTFVVKDVIDVAGSVTGAGNPDWASEREPAEGNAASVQTLLDAGAGLAGKGQCAELAFSLSGGNVHFGMPENSAAPDRDPGGSTSGPAAAVAGGLCDLGVGTDTLGSIRVPASYCGLYGFRPTHGAISTEGVMPLAQPFDTVGALARDSGALVRAVEVLLGGSVGETRPPDRLLLSERAFACAEPAVATAAREAAQKLAETLGSELAETDPLADAPSPADSMAAFNVLQGRRVWTNYGEWFETTSPSVGPDVAARLERARGFGPDDVAGAEPVAERVAGAVGGLAADEALVIPTVGTLAPHRDAGGDEREAARAGAGQLTCIATLAGAPAITLPHIEVDGMPAGLSLVAAPGRDLMLLAASAAREGPSSGPTP